MSIDWRTTFRQAELGPRHIHPFAGVSRESASQWLNGWTKPRKQHEEKMEKLAECVRRALADKALPVSRQPGMKASEHRAQIIRILVDDYGADYDKPSKPSRVSSSHPAADGTVLRS